MDKYTKHPTHNHPAGKYTDDTQMSIAVAEAIIFLQREDAGIILMKW